MVIQAQTTSCDTVSTVPWTENFNALVGTAYNVEGLLPDCWRSYWNGSDTALAPHVINAYPYGSVHNYLTSGQQALLLLAGTTGLPGIDSVAIVESPRVAGGLNGKQLSFYYMQESANYGNLYVGYMQDSTFVTLADLPQQQTGQTVTLRFDSIPAGVDRIALRWRKIGMWYSVIVDNVELVALDSVPTVAIATPQQVGVDSVLFRAYLIDGLNDSLTYSWHSTMAAAGLATLITANDSAYIVYSAQGTDTVSVIATNAYGVDTAWVPFTFVGAPETSINGPSTVQTGVTVTYTAQLSQGSTNGITYSWQSSMAAAGHATMTATGNTLQIVYFTGGTDTLTVITTNTYGVDTTIRIISVSSICHITTFPWTEGFENGLPSCWSTWSNNNDEWMHHWRISNQTYEAHNGSRCIWSQNLSGDYVNTQDWLMMPPVELPALSNMSLNFYAWFSGDDPGLAVLVSTQGRSDLNHFSDTLFFEQTYTGATPHYVMRSVSLAAYAGQTIWIAFVHANQCWTLHLDDISIDHTDVPVAAISGPATQLSSEEALFTAHLVHGDTAGVSYTWHSTMADAGLATLTATDSTVAIEYHAGGIDHVSVVIANAAGSDSAAMTCTVIDCEPITQLPYTVCLNNSSDLTCWQKGGWYITNYYSTGVTCMTADNMSHDPVDKWLVMREIAIPADYTQSYTLRWHIICDHSKYQVLVSTQGRSDHSLFDTLYYEQNDTSSFFANQWTSHTLSLDAYRRQNIYIAFRNLGWYNSPTHYADGGAIRIDTIQVSADTLPTPPPDTVWRTVTVSTNVSGVETYGSGLYVDSSTVEIGYHLADTSTVGGHWQFLGWDDGGTGNPRDIVVTSDTAIVALFEWVADTTTQAITQSDIQAITIYPNPATHQVSIECSETISEARLTDLTGRREQVRLTAEGTGRYTLDLTACPQATYLLSLTTASGKTHTVRLLKH